MKTKATAQILKTALLIVALFVTAQAHADEKHERDTNCILRRQQAYQVQGLPTSRLIFSKREIDIYPNGLMFEGDHVVGVKGGR